MSKKSVVRWFDGWCPRKTLITEGKVVVKEDILKLVSRRVWYTAAVLGLLLVLSGVIMVEATTTAGVYLDNVAVYADGRLILSDDFIHRNIVDTGWKATSGVELQEKCVYSPPYALNLSQESRFVGAFHEVQIGEGWKTVNYTAYVTASRRQAFEYIECQCNGRVTHSQWTIIRLYSGSSQSSIAAGVFFQSLSYRNLPSGLGLYIENKATNDATRLVQEAYHTRFFWSPFNWYKISLSVDRASGEAYMYLDQTLILRLKLTDINLFKSFSKVSIEVWADATLP